MNKLVKNSSRLIAKTKFLIIKRSPEIFLVGGIGLIIGGAVWACQKSRKLDAVLDCDRGDRESLKAEYIAEQERKADAEEMMQENPEEVDPDDLIVMTEKEYSKECRLITLTTASELVKMYAIPSICIVAGIGMIVQGHRILCKRNAALLAAYTALDKSFEEYRNRVRERYGEDTERDIYNGTSYEVALDEDGKPKKPKELVPVMGYSVSPYAILFNPDDTKEWQRSPDLNYIFLKCQQNAANDRLWRDGYLFLNTARKMLGFKETAQGALCGWILPTDAKSREDMDGYVDFRIFDDSGSLDPSKVDEEGYILIDFNCQGVIYDKIDKL